MPKIDFVIFDCDGVLIDSEVIANQAEVDLKTELGFPITLEDQCRRFTGLGKSHPDLIKEMARYPADYGRRVDERVRVLYPQKLRAIDGAAQVVQRLPFPKCVASSSEAEWLDFKLKLTGLDGFFKGAIFNGEMVERCKPEPDLFLHAIRTMGWTGRPGLVIEDSVPGVLAGVAAGLQVCGFLGGGHIFGEHRERLQAAGAHFIISHFRELDSVLRQLS